MSAPWWVWLAMTPVIVAALWVVAQAVAWPDRWQILLPRWRERRPR